MSKERFAEFRKIVIKMILATNLSKHFGVISQLKSITSGTLAVSADGAGSAPSGVGLADTPLLLSTAIKFADIGHSLKPWEQHERWSLRVSDEMFLLGDREREMKLAISPLCDRYSDKDTAMADNQVNFFRFHLLPVLQCGPPRRAGCRRSCAQPRVQLRRVDAPFRRESRRGSAQT
jgi:hypothetical protein